MAAALDQARTLFTDDSSFSQAMPAFIDVLIPLASAAGAKQMASIPNNRAESSYREGPYHC